MPNVQQDEPVRLVGRTALLRFRAVYAAEQVEPPPAPEPTATGSPSPSAEPSAEPSSGATPSASTTAGAQPTPSGNNKPFPALPTAPPQPPDKACQAADGKGTRRPTRRWNGSRPRPAQAAFAEFTCDQKPNDVPDQALFACDQTGTESTCLAPR